MARPADLEPPRTEDPVPGALAAAIAVGWRGLTLVTGRAPSRPVTLVHAPAEPGPAGAARLGLTLAGGRLALCLAGSRPGTRSPRLVLDLRMAAARALVGAMAGAGELPLVDLGRPAGCPSRAGRASLGDAAETLRTACARAGEWHVQDPGDGLAASIRYRLEAAGPLPRLISGPRLGDPPTLVVPAGGEPALQPLGLIPAGCASQAALAARAAGAGRLRIAEVALVDPPVVTAIRQVTLRGRDR